MCGKVSQKKTKRHKIFRFEISIEFYHLNTTTQHKNREMASAPKSRW